MKRGEGVTGSRGFTLLEVLIAVTLLGVAMVSLLGLHARNIRLTAEAQDLTLAGMLASQVITATRTGAFPDLGTQDGDFSERAKDADTHDTFYGGADSAGFVWKREVLPTALDSLRQVRVSVSRRDQPRALAELWVAVSQHRP